MSQISKKQLNVALRLAHSIWREALLSLSAAPTEVIRHQSRLLLQRRDNAITENVCSEYISGALKFVVLKHVVAAVNNPNTKDHRDLYYAIATEIETKYGINIRIILDAVLTNAG